MFKYLGFFFFIYLTYSQTPIVISDISNTIVLSPPNLYPVYSYQHNVNSPNYLGSGAQWIFVNGGDSSGSWPAGYTAVFQTLFYSFCPKGSAILKIIADDVYTAILNGNVVGSGTLNKVDAYTINNLQCGLNNLTVQVINTGGVAAVIYSITQSQIDCYQCGPEADYDFDACRCQCRNIYLNRDFQRTWVGYPICANQCKNRQTISCDPKTQYFNNQDCACQCVPQLCNSNNEQDPFSCQCRCKARQCPSGKVWSYSTCGCVNKPCPLFNKCTPPKLWNRKSCQCLCPSPNYSCEVNQQWDSNACACVDKKGH